MIVDHLQQPVVRQAIGLSVRTSLTATLLTVIAGTPVAYLMAYRPFPGRDALATLIDLPTVLPPAVAGVGLLLAFGRRGLIGSALSIGGIELAFTPTAVVLAQIFVAAPFFLRAAILGFTHVDEELLQSAALDGATEVQAFRHVVVPLSRNAMLTGAVMMWARALGEFGATIIFAGNLPGRTQTMPLAIYIGFELDMGVALTLSVILLALSFVVLALFRRLLPDPN
jgi:molybdate transport system permease protein